MSITVVPFDVLHTSIQPQPLNTLLALRATNRFLRDKITSLMITAAQKANLHIQAQGNVDVSDFQKVMYKFCLHQSFDTFKASHALFRQALSYKNLKIAYLPTNVLHLEWIKTCESQITTAIRKTENEQTLQQIWVKRLVPALIKANPREATDLRGLYSQVTHKGTPCTPSEWMERNRSLLNKVTKLNLEELYLRILPPEIFLMTGLKKLDLSSNPNLLTLPPEIGRLKKLEVLNFQGRDCKKMQFPSEMKHLQNLRIFNVTCFYSFNKSIVILPKEMKSFSKLKIYKNATQQIQYL